MITNRVHLIFTQAEFATCCAMATSVYE